jgi:hypothetical protein
MTFWIGYAVLVSLVCGLLALARRPGNRPAPGSASHRPWALPPTLPAPTATTADVAAAAAVALPRVRPLLASQFSHIDIAIAPGLSARMRPPALADLLEEMLTRAVHAAPASNLLLTALRQDDQIEIAVVDDMAGADPAYRHAQLRGLQERAALRGASLQVSVHAASGTTTTLRVLEAQEAKRPVPAPETTAAVEPRLAVDGTGT